MTTQISDGFDLDGAGYSVVCTSNDILFDPAILDLNPAPATMACWRGYQAVFTVAEKQLLLKNLHLNLSMQIEKENESPRPILINGIAPVYEDADRGIVDRFFNHHYEGVALPLTYSGGLLLGTAWIPRRGGASYPFWRYKMVLELVFAEGVLQAQYDRSQESAAVRAQFDAWRVGEGEMPSKEQMREYMMRSFAYIYTYAI